MQELIEWGDDLLINNPSKLLSFGGAIDKAAQLIEKEKRQILDAMLYALDEDGHNGAWMINFVESYYKKMYEKKSNSK